MKNKQFDKTVVAKTGKDLLALMGTKVNRSQNTGILMPTGITEIALYNFWEALLGHNNFGVTDNFFEVGGNSLKAIQLLSRISSNFFTDISLTHIFLQPTIAQIALLILEYKSSDTKSNAIILAKERPALIPLSFNQERLFFIDQLEGSVKYHTPAVLRLRGKLKEEAVAYAFTQIVNRHQVLRTCIREKEGVHYQYINDENAFEISFYADKLYTNNAEELQQYIRQVIDKPFDLLNDCMLRATLIKLDEELNILVITLHHIASDGWSVSIIIKELLQYYNAFQNNNAVNFAPLPIQYADFAIWQRQYLQGDLLNKRLAYWKHNLENLSPLQLPTDFIRPAVQTYSGKSHKFLIERELTDQLNHFSQQQGCTLYIALVTALNILLHKYSNQNDISIGTATAGRPQQELEGLVGFFVNTLVLRNIINSDLSFIQFLDQVKLSTLSAFENQELPFEKVVEAVAIERDRSRSPLFQVMFILQNTPQKQSFQLTDLTVSEDEFITDTARFELEFSLTETEEGIEAFINYSTDLYKPDTIERMVLHFKQLLLSIVQEPTKAIHSLVFIDSNEVQKILFEFNNLSAIYANTKDIVTLFEEQVSVSPNNIALIFEDEQLTYKELNERSNQLANYLVSNGVKCETLVPICVERSMQMIIGVLGILKAGGAYVPIDHDYPSDRISFMLTDTKAKLIIATSRTLAKLQIAKAVSVIEIDGVDKNAIECQPIDNLTIEINANHLAYVMYTSGSTGMPKGVLVEHGNVVSLVKEMDYVTLDKKDVLLSTGSPSFDATTFEYWGMLLNRGKLVLCTDDKLLNVKLLAQEIISNKVNKMWFTSSWFNQLVETDIFVFSTLKTILVGGEKLSEYHIKKIRKTYPDLVIINGYGPTENTTFSLTYNIDEVDFNSSIPIGKPLNNRNAYILDEHNNLVAIGLPGEICIGGNGVARGYLNHAELTNSKFIKDYFNTNSYSRLYKTGDVGRWLPDGNIEYLSRLDDQVKVRGYRIELSEIEAVLQQSGLVKQSIVLAKQDHHSVNQLVGYIVLKQHINTEVVTAYLKDKLPSYMLPALLIAVESMPLTGNGKIDKKALPVINFNQLKQHQYTPPKTELEIELVAIWQQIMNIERIGINDSFFDLGGHSILAMRLIAAIRQKIGIDVNIKSLFHYPTINELAADIGNEKSVVFSNAIQVQQRFEYLPLSYSQQRLWFIHQLEASVQYHLPAVFDLTGNLNETALIASFLNVINRHEILRTVYLEKDGLPYQHINNIDGWSIDKIKVENINYKNEIIQQIIDKPFDLATDLMLRASLLSINENENILVVVLHHIASDAWSLPIIIKEITKHYNDTINHRLVSLQQLPIQYADYAVWQRNAQDDLTDNSVQFWQTQLLGVQPLQLLTDHVRPAIQSTRGSIENFKIDQSIYDELKTISRQHQTTLFVTLLTSINVLLSRYTGQDDITVGSPVANRTQHEVESLIGFFVNTLTLRCNLSNDPSFVNLLYQVKQTTLNAYHHQELPFEKVIEAVSFQRDFSRTPLFQVMFVLQNTAQETMLQMDGIKAIAVPVESKSVKFELTFNLTENENGLSGYIEYSTDLFDSETIKRLIGHFQKLLESIGQIPAQPISKLSILPQREIDQLVNQFSHISATYPTGKTIVDLIEVQVNIHPLNIAVVDENEKITYRQLNERSNQLAHYLRSKGAVADMLIPICLDRGIDMIVAILGVLKSGAAYVPIDPAYPSDRISFMLEDTAAVLVIGSLHTKHHIQHSPNCELIIIENELLNDQPLRNLSVQIKPEDLAYVIYTSGSTGKPKGVLIPHKNVVRLFKTTPSLFDFDEKDVWSVFHSFSFDFSVWEMYGALFYGGKMVIVPKHITKDTAAFSKLLLDEKVTILNQTPSAFYVLQEALLDSTQSVPMRMVIFGGEALNPANLQPFKTAYPNTKLINMYGITETTVHVTYQQIECEHILKGKSNIGKPIPTLSAFIVDANLNLVPVGVAGEMLIGGAGLARGYLNQPELTAEKFIDNPFSKLPGDKLYKTGDHGLWLADGSIEYLGRIDGQVKIRGYRIELGEIEAVLNECANVRQAVVLAKTDKDGNKILVGYIVPEDKLNIDDVCDYLRTKLQDYMIPFLWVEVEKFPLTFNGKTDKKALLERDVNVNLKNEFIAPRNEDEIIAASIWKEILNVERVGINDSFFELGGDSIKVIRVVNKLKQAFKKEVKVFDIYHASTLQQLVEIINSSPFIADNAERTIIMDELESLKASILPVIENRDAIADIFPMSDIQSGMVYASLVNPILAIYHDQFAYPLIKNLNTDIFESVLKLLINKNPIFRTAFNLDIHTEGLQIVYKSVPLKLEYIDLQVTESNESDFVKQYFSEQRQIPFVLNLAPLWRFTIIQFKDKNMLMFQFHHALLDGWSIAVFNTELNNLYLRLLNNPIPAFLEPLKITYKDFIIASIADKNNEDNNGYWLNELADYKRLDIFSPEATSQTLNRNYGANYLDKLDKRTKEDGITLKGLFFGAYLYSLSMLTPENEITVGVVSNTRPVLEDGDNLLGCFLNTIPARIKMKSIPINWKEYFNEIENKLIELKQRDRTTLLQIATITGEKAINGNPFFDALFSFTNFHVYNNFEDGLLLNTHDNNEEIFFEEDSEDLLTNTFLNFIVIISNNVLKVHYRLRHKLKSDKTLIQLNQYFDHVINCYLNHYHETINRNNIIGKEELQILLSGSNKITNIFSDKTVVNLFEQQVENLPGTTAIVFEGNELTYEQLNERANKLANYLQNIGIKEESLVPIYIDRGINMIVCILGILKAGAAYVPIDTDFPSTRIAYMLDEIGSPILLSDSKTDLSLKINYPINIIEIDGDLIKEQSFQNPITNLNVANAAYVIFTSGSTGKPKGVTIEHKNLSDYIAGLNDKIQINKCKTFALVSTIATDLGNTILYASLLSGGTLHLFSKETTSNADTLNEYFTNHSIDCLKIVPSHWQALCTNDELLLPKKLLIFGGEVLRTEIVTNILATNTACKIVNHYGPTETTIGKLLHVIEHNKVYASNIPIGKPFSNSQVYVLNKNMEPVAVGVPGQLFIAGDGVARGYFNSVEITNEKFIVNPFVQSIASKIYATGDLVKYLPDGNIAFIGRVDDQVKVRGYRIELNEIENAINLCPMVKQGIVLAREDKQGNKKLIAYIVPKIDFDKSAITHYLKEVLPEYMIPAVIIELTKMPLTANGKVDKNALPDLDAAEMNEYAQPRNETEKSLAEIWQQLLDVEQVGIHDNFFELGGDSIITIQLVSRARRAGIELQIGDVFTYQTIARLSSMLVQRVDVINGESDEQFLLEGSSGLLPIQQWFLQKAPIDISHFNQSVLLNIDKAVSVPVLKRSIEVLLTQHDALRFKYFKKDESWNQVYQAEYSGVLTADFQMTPDHLLSQTITDSADKYQRSLDIEKGDLLRVVLMQTPENVIKNKLLIIIHHLAVDGVSWRILLQDLELLFTGLLSGGETYLGKKTTSYRQWYDALVTYGQSYQLLSQQGYWENVISNYKPFLTDKKDESEIQVKDTSHFSMRLSSLKTKQLLQDVPKVYHTEVNDILVASLARTLSDWGGFKNVVISMEGHGRENIDAGLNIANTVGWFTTHYPISLKVDSSDDSADLIKSIKEQLRHVPDKGIGFGVLKYINNDEAFKEFKSADIIFNYLGQADNILANSKWFSAAEDSAGADRSEQYIVSNKLAINGMVQGGELLLNFTYSNKHYNTETIIKLVHQFQQQLELLIDHCIQNYKLNGATFTPSDYGLGSQINYKELDLFLSESTNGIARKNLIESMYPLSGLQQGMLFHGLYENGSSGYVNHFWCDLINPNIDILRKSWNRILETHSILRSAFHYDVFNIPIQVVYKKVELPIEVIDLRHFDEPDLQAAINQFAAADLKKGFDFKVAPLMRISLLRLPENRYGMLWSSHHILFDGWSRAILMGDFLKMYEVFLTGNSFPPAAEDNYEDYIRYIENIDKEKQQFYWKNYLQHINQSTLLPFIKNTAERNKGLGLYNFVALNIDQNTTIRIEKYTQRSRITLNTLVQSVWAYLLHRYTGNEDIVYGVIVSGRPDDFSNIEQRIGLYINVLPVYTDFKQTGNVVEWMQNIQKDQVASRNYQYTPLQQIQEWTGVKGDLFDSFLVFENYPVSKLLSSTEWKLKVENVHINEQTNYPLSILVNAADEINIEFNYNTALLSEVNVIQIANHFEHVLLQIIDNDTLSINNIELLSQAEKNVLLHDLNNNAVDYPTHKTIITLIEEQAQKTPDTVAVIFGNQQMTYKELDEKSNQLGHYLINSGVTEETLVPICLERSIEMIIGILGVLKADGAYVPIDPEYPASRISYMLQDTGAKIILTSNDSKLRLPEVKNLKVINLNSDWAQIQKEDNNKVQNKLRSKSLACVIYTSGSTGKPKGVMNEHGALVNRLCWAQDYFKLTNEDAVLQKTTFCFDVSVWELLWPLMAGSKLVFAKPDGHKDPQYLRSIIETENITMVHFVPSMLGVFLSDISVGDCSSLTKIICSGEALKISQVKLFQQKLSGAQLHNLYGPTEAAIDVTYWSLNNSDNLSIIPIGKPVANTSIYLLDKQNKLVPFGAIGEIIIGGIQVARGYLNLPELTAQKFIFDSFSNVKDATMYRTGDLGRWQQDGNLEYLGRIDDQIKIRGFRVELGEIESFILTVHGIRNVKVILLENENSFGTKLCAYVEIDPEKLSLENSTTIIDQLKNELEKALPDYMVPSNIILMEAFPLTPNGKIDKKALPLPDSIILNNLDYVAPQTNEEVALVHIWEELLERKQIGIHDNFFQLGGQSLLAMRVMSAVRRQLKKEMAIKTLFLYPTVKQFAAQLIEQQAGVLLPAINVQERGKRIPLSFSQERLWFIDKLEGSLQYHLPSIIHLKGNLNKEALSNALQEIVNRHEVLRTVIHEEHGAGYQHINNKNTWQLHVADYKNLLNQDSQELQNHILQLIQLPFNLSTDNMLRANLIKIGEYDYILVVTMHHIASDGWSTSIIVKELVELYDAFVNARPATLSPINIQFADYSIWQRNYLTGNVIDDKLSYWKSKLEGFATLHLPTDYTRPIVQSSRGARIAFTIDKQLSDNLQLLSREQGTTIFMTLFAAYNVLMHRYSGQNDICVGTPVSNRTQQEFESLIGFFINTLVLRSDLSGNPTFTDFLQQVKTTTLEAYEHQDMPFEKVVEAIVKERDMSRNPLFQVLFTMQNTPIVPELKLGEISLQLQPLAHTTSQLDIICNLIETPEGLSASVEYCTDLFSEQTVHRMMGHFQQLLRSVIEDPEQRVGALSMLSSAEKSAQILCRDKSALFTNGTTIIHLFEEQVVKNAGKLAAIYQSEKLTYLQLNERVNQLASYLLLKGVVREMLVPICIERSIDMLVAVWAILKTGAAYVPIDPAYPQERIHFILQDTNASIILTNANSKINLQPEKNHQLILLDNDWPLISLQAKLNLETIIDPNQLAYVIYTSGSTGKPKGVMVEHQQMLHYLENKQTKYIHDYLDGAGSFVHLSFTFDASLTAMFMPLLAGKFVVISARDVMEIFEDDNFEKYAPYSFIKITPSHLSLLQTKMQTANGHLLTKKLVIGGEALLTAQFKYFIEQGINVEIINEYGPTESTVGCSVFTFNTIGDEEKLNHGISIGKPIDNVQMYILGQYNELLPPIAIGELYIGGAGIARGYINLPDLTNEKFITNIFQKDKKTKLYKTGDIARWLPDGNIEFIGRKDEQVKIRGYRVELGEIENVLQQCSLVSNAVVLAKENKEGTKRLIAYIVPVEDFDKEPIQAYVQNFLPEYMVPVQWVQLDELPLTSNGKIDRKFLNNYENVENDNITYTAPRNDFEKVLADIWQQLLDVEEMGIHDNFFERGGDSIISIQVVSRARRAGYEFQVADVFSYQTIATLSDYFHHKMEIKSTDFSEQLLLTGEAGLLPIQQWYFDQQSKEVSYFNQSVLLQIAKAITATILQTAVDQLLHHHDALRFNYQHKDTIWKQEYGSMSDPFVQVDLSDSSHNLLVSLIENESAHFQRSLNIENGEIVKFVLLKTPQSETHNRLLIVVHHLVIDGVSWRILLEDIELLLTNLSNNHPVDLGKKTDSYRQWYDALKIYGQNENLLSQITYWEKVVKSSYPLPLDNDYNGNLKQQEKSSHNVSLSLAQTRNLLQDVNGVYHTEINDLLIAALAKTIIAFTCKSYVVIGMEGHGRENIAQGIDTSRTVGWFTTHYPFFIDLNEIVNEEDLIKSTKEQLRQVPEKGVGYGVIKYINKNELFDGDHPWEIVFNYLGQLDNVINTSKWLSKANELSGDNISNEYMNADKISINAAVSAEGLMIKWSYSKKHFNAETIELLAENYVLNLRTAIDHCMQKRLIEKREFTPSDFGLGNDITYQQLDIFLNGLQNQKPRRDTIESLYKLSGLQQGILFHGLYDEDGTGYLNQFWCDLINPDLTVLRKCWNHIMQSNTILRSSFDFNSFNIPLQAVYKNVQLPIEILDFSGITPEDQLIAIEQFADNDRIKAFDFTTSPLMRITLIRLDDYRYKMLWSSHHILFDGWSRAVLMGEFLKLYELVITGNFLPAIAEDRYEDYIRYIQKIDKNKETEYWKNYLKPISQSTLLPFITTTNKRNKGVGLYESVYLNIDTDTTFKAEQFAQNYRITINTLVQGVWAYLLHEYTGNNNVVYGVVVAGRPDDLPNIEQRIGMFINTLPLLASFKVDNKIGEWMQNIQQDQVLSRQYQYSPLPDVQRVTGIKGDLFDTLLVFENYPVSKIIASGKWTLGVENISVNEKTNYPLSLIINHSTEIKIAFSYNSDLLKQDIVQKISNHFKHVLTQIIENFDGKISDIELLTPYEKKQLLFDFNPSKILYEPNKTIVNLIEDQAACIPDGIALIMDDDTITYHELNKLVNQLAHYLQTKGVTNNTLVPVCIERSFNMVICMLAVIKAGAAYVPIDPQYPEERILYTIEDTAASIILTSTKCIDRLPKNQSFSVVLVDEDWSLINSMPTHNLSSTIAPDQLAYVIYTSGSTGKPKGVMIQHSNIYAFINWCKSEFVNSDFEMIYASTSICFDLSIFEIFYPLTIGKPIRILENGLHIPNYINNDKLVMINCVPGVIQNLLNEKIDISNISVINMAGEPIPLQVQQSLNTNAIEVRNLYGPTEDTTYSTVSRLNNIEPANIGKPISNTAVYIVNTSLQLVPIGVTGEICIGGEGLAKGYLNRKELTEQKFITNLFVESINEKIYRTGDLGRWLEDGNIEYLGRIDDQVKIRGYRIELGEIEMVLQQSGFVSKAVVLAKNAVNGELRLVGYVVPSPMYNQQSMIAFMRTVLPDFMVPVLWVKLKEFPLTSTGKVDKNLLLDPDASELLANQFVVPVTELQIKLAEIWKEILGIQRVGIHDNFFELGGHSLLVMRLISAVKRALHVELSVTTFFELVTIQQLANYIEVNKQAVIVTFENYDTIKL